MKNKIGLPNWFPQYEAQFIEKKQLMLPAARELFAPSVEQAHAFVRLFDFFNAELFAGVLGSPLPHPILNFSRSRGRGSAAFFQARSWQDPQTGEFMDEISLVPEWTNRDLKEVLSTLVHEMAHFLDHLNGTSCKNGYHGRGWFKIMKRLGLPGKPHGNSMVKVHHDIDPDGAFMKAFAKLPGDLVLPFTTSLPKDWHLFGTGQVKKQTLQGKRAKYQCPLCAQETNGGRIMRGPSGMQIRCMTHDEEMPELGF